MDNKKINFAQRVEEAAKQLAQAVELMNKVQDIWTDRAYGPGGVNEITADDLIVNPNSGIDVRVTPAGLAEFMAAAAQIKKFLRANASAVAGDYMTTFNKLRNDM